MKLIVVLPVLFMYVVYLASAAEVQQRFFFIKMDTTGSNPPAKIEWEHFTNSMEDMMFGDTKREYVFGGYVERDDDGKDIHFQHKSCKPGFYSPKPRLNNPRTLDSKDCQGNSCQFKVYNIQTRQQQSPAACCAFTNYNLKCCKKVSLPPPPPTGLGEFVDKIAEVYTYPQRKLTEFVHDELLGKYKCKNNLYECSLKEETCVRLSGGDIINDVAEYDAKMEDNLQVSYAYGVKYGFTKALNAGSKITQAAAGPLGKLVFNKMSTDSTITPKVMCSDKWSANVYDGDFQNFIDSGWGPYMPSVTKADQLLLRPFDRGWSHDNQCKPCSRFGNNFYTNGKGPHSACFKAGPGKMANAKHDGTYDSEESRHKWSVFTDSQDPDVIASQQSIIVTWKNTDVTESHKTVEVQALYYKGSVYGYSKPTPYEQCEFIYTPEDAKETRDIKLARDCILDRDAKFRFNWPVACGDTIDLTACRIYAVVYMQETLSTGQTKYLDGKKSMGDTRKFAHVKLKLDSGNQTVKIHPVSKMRYGQGSEATLSNFRAVKGQRLTYKLYTQVVNPSELGCSTYISKDDVVSTYNTFTYYYPANHNYYLSGFSNNDLAYSYEALVAEQKAEMEYFQRSSVSTKYQDALKESFVFRFSPSKNKLKAAACIERKAGPVSFCSTKSTGSDKNYRWEGLPPQSNVYEDEVQWANEEHYFGNFPNYDQNDVDLGWKTSVAKKPKLPAHRVLRASAMCVSCAAGYKGAKNPSLNGRRFLRAVLGPVGDSLSVGGVRVYNSDYERICEKCSPGTYNDRAGENCKFCKAGHFSTSDRLAGRVPAFMVTQAPKRCWLCLKGFECPKQDLLETAYACPSTGLNVSIHGNMCPCRVGRYQNERGKTACKLCPRGRTTTQVGSTSINACKPGAVLAGFRFRGPYVKDFGNYAPLSNINDQNIPKPKNLDSIECQAGSYSPVARHFSESSVICTLCSAGYFTDKTGSIYCVACPSGTYNTKQGSTSCLKCEKPNYIVGYDHTNCTECAKDYFSATKYDSHCRKCPPCTGRSIGSEDDCTFMFGNNDDSTHAERWEKCDLKLTDNSDILKEYLITSQNSVTKKKGFILTKPEARAANQEQYNSIHTLELVVMFMLWWAAGTLFAFNGNLLKGMTEDDTEINYWNEENKPNPVFKETKESEDLHKFTI